MARQLALGESEISQIVILDQYGEMMDGVVLDADTALTSTSDDAVLTSSLSPDQAMVTAYGASEGDATLTVTGAVGELALSGSLEYTVGAGAQPPVPTSIGFVPSPPIEQ